MKKSTTARKSKLTARRNYSANARRASPARRLLLSGNTRRARKSEVRGDGGESSGDSLRIYLNEMNRTPLLSRGQEVALAKQLGEARDRARQIAWRLGFVVRAYVEKAREILRGEQRFDHAVAEQDRENYLKRLPSLCRRVELEAAHLDILIRSESSRRAAGRGRGEIPARLEKLQLLLERFAFKPALDFSGLVEAKNTELQLLVRQHRNCPDLARRRRLAAAIRKAERSAWVEAKELAAHARQLRHWQHKAQEARDAIAAANLRLVVSIAKKYVNRGVQLPDLIQEGNIGLIKAVDKFDHRLGHKFSTYATWWISQSVSRAVGDQGRLIRIPIHMNGTISKLLSAQRRLAQDYGRDLSPEELASELQMSEKRVRAMLSMVQHPVSIDAPVGEDGDSKVGDFIEDRCSRSPDSAAAIVLLKDNLQQALALLDDREQAVLLRRFGMKDGTPETLQDIGRDLKVTRERVRQIEAKALRKLRHPSRLRLLSLTGEHGQRKAA